MLPSGASVLVDANIFIYSFGQLSRQCNRLIARLETGDVFGSLTTIIAAETLHRRMLIEAVDKGLVTSSQVLKKLKAHPEIVQQLSDYITEAQKISQLPITVIVVTPQDIQRSHQLRRQFGLLVNDSINLACAQRLGIVHVATHDDDFDCVAGITVWKPTDI
jgi:predicted nucleic acid-binding protein